MNKQMQQMLPSEMMSQALQALQQENGNLRQELYIRSAPRVAELINAVGELTAAAERGDPNAKAALQGLFKTLDNAREASGKIQVVKA